MNDLTEIDPTLQLEDLEWGISSVPYEPGVDNLQYFDQVVFSEDCLQLDKKYSNAGDLDTHLFLIGDLNFSNASIQPTDTSNDNCMSVASDLLDTPTIIDGTENLINEHFDIPIQLQLNSQSVAQQPNFNTDIGAAIVKSEEAYPQAASGNNSASTAGSDIALSSASTKIGKERSSGKVSRKGKRKGVPKEKMYMIKDRFIDEKEEKRRLNAIKAHDNRQKSTQNTKKLNNEIYNLQTTVTEKDQQMKEKDQLIQQQQQIIIDLKGDVKLEKEKLLNFKSELSKMITNI